MLARATFERGRRRARSRGARTSPNGPSSLFEFRPAAARQVLLVSANRQEVRERLAPPPDARDALLPHVDALRRVLEHAHDALDLAELVQTLALRARGDVEVVPASRGLVPPKRRDVIFAASRTARVVLARCRTAGVFSTIARCRTAGVRSTIAASDRARRESSRKGRWQSQASARRARYVLRFSARVTSSWPSSEGRASAAARPRAPYALSLTRLSVRSADASLVHVDRSWIGARSAKQSSSSGGRRSDLRENQPPYGPGDRR